MSSLFDRISHRFHAGHDGGMPPELFGDQRLEGVTDFRPAAVLVAITERERPGILLLHRPSNMRAHPGQIAFPGGKLDPGETASEAALREAHEELGIREADVRIIGETDLYKTHSGYEITPVLAVVPPDLEIVPNPAEVAQWFEAPTAFLFDRANHIERQLEWEGSPRTYYEINWQGHEIWGVTAALIVNLSRRLRIDG